MRKLLFLVASVVLASSASIGCNSAEGSVDDDEEFDNDWKDDFENDDEEATEESKETDELDELDDLDDPEDKDGMIFPAETEATTDPEGGPGPGDEAPPEGTDEYIEATTGTDPGVEPGTKPPPKKPRKHGPISIIEDDPNFSGSAGYDGSGKPLYDKAKSDERLDRAKALGADAIRIMLWWKDKVPGGAESTTKPKGFVSSRPDQYDWRAFDMQVEGARNRGMKVMVTIPARTARKRRSRHTLVTPGRSRRTRVCEVRPGGGARVSSVTADGSCPGSRGLRGDAVVRSSGPRGGRWCGPAV
jgi:hypothetical protein